MDHIITNRTLTQILEKLSKYIRCVEFDEMKS